MLYSIGRVFTESLRIDPAQLIFGVRFNLLLFIGVAILGGVWFFVNLSRARPAS